MVKVIKNKEYYRQFEELTNQDLEKARYHRRMANYYKRKYESTKGKDGFYALMNMLAKSRREYHVSQGFRLAIASMASCISELDDLSKHIEAIQED